jgi:hypothetical protein
MEAGPSVLTSGTLGGLIFKSKGISSLKTIVGISVESKCIAAGAAP